MAFKKFKYINLLIFFLYFSYVGHAQYVVGSEALPSLYQKAYSLYQQKDYGSALELFDAFAAKEKSGVLKQNSRYYAILCAVNLGDADVLYRITKFSNEYPESVFLPEINMAMADYYFKQGRFSVAYRIFEKIIPDDLSKPLQYRYFYQKGVCLIKRKKYTQALKLLNNVINVNTPYAIAANYYYAYISYRNGNFEKALQGFEKIKNKPGFKNKVPAYLLQIYYEQDSLEKVISEGTEYLKIAKRNVKPQIALLLANSYYQKGDYRNALLYFKKYLDNTRETISPVINYRIGVSLFYQEEFSQSVTYFQNASRENTELAQSALLFLGKAYLKTGEDRFAQTAFYSAYELQKNTEFTATALFSYLKVTLRLKGDPYHDPVKVTEQFINNPHISPKQKDRAAALLLQLYLKNQNKYAAIASIERKVNPGAILREAYQKLTYQQAIEDLHSGRFRQALSYFSKSLKYTPDNTLRLKSIFWLGDSYFRLGNYRAAVKYYKTFLISRAARNLSFYYRTFYNLGYAYFDMRNYTAAIEFFKRFLMQNRAGSRLKDDALLRIADSYLMNKNYEAAITYYNRVINATSNQAPYALYQKAYCYGVKGEFSKKVKTLQQLVSGFPHSVYFARSLYDIADTYNSALNDSRSAIIYFNKLISEQPGSLFARKALVKMGLLYYQNNQNNKAIAVLKQVVSKYPASSEAKIALGTLESIYKDEGNLQAYFNYARKLDFVQISKSREDSLSFSVGEDAYLTGNCKKVISSLNSYLKNFPQGGYVLKSYYYLAKCYLKEKDTVQTLNMFNKIIGYPENDFTVSALIHAARINYSLKKYHDAEIDYSRLYNKTDDLSLKIEAADGSMRSAFLAGDGNTAVYDAKRLLSITGISADQIVYAHYVLGQVALKSDNYREAEKEFNIVQNLSKGVLGAESAYYIAKIDFNKGEYDNAEKKIFEISDKFPGEVYWVAKSFILLSDIYVKKGNIFQARETLKSVLNNYPGNYLKDIARKKLQMLPTEKK